MHLLLSSRLQYTDSSILLLSFLRCRELMKRRCAKATSSPGWKLLRFYQQGEGMLSQMAYLHT